MATGVKLLGKDSSIQARGRAMATMVSRAVSGPFVTLQRHFISGLTVGVATG